MGDQEGLVLQGCGGDPQEWVDGINDMLTEADILLNGSLFKLEDVSLFQHGELTCLLFPFEGASCPYGASRPMLNSAEPGCPIMCPTGWGALSRNRLDKSPP